MLILPNKLTGKILDFFTLVAILEAWTWNILLIAGYKSQNALVILISNSACKVSRLSYIIVKTENPFPSFIP